MLAFVRLLRAHQAITRRLSAELLRSHGLTLNDYEVLLHLSFEDERKLRRVDLAERMLLTASGITRLLDGLEHAGYVTKSNCSTDARVTYAVLTDAGLAKLREAAGAHIAGVNELLGETLDDRGGAAPRRAAGAASPGSTRTSAAAPPSSRPL